ncbi:MerR family transcriptional regulator [Streptomyces poriticola]|uniref:MerR family transcriptional regulator n=1 Tax=Streptomyces poriticola TaxID=3120506 RepID=UPI0038CD949C
MESTMGGIGEMARDSGLCVSALRFYDRAGVLVPARVDPVTGYRWYEPGQLGEARLPARLCRAGMPLADVRLVLAGWSWPAGPAPAPAATRSAASFRPICTGSNKGRPRPAPSSPRSETCSTTGRTP